MKRKLAFFMIALAVVLSAMTFSGTKAQVAQGGCPLAGTPLCPEYPACCK